MRAKKKKKKRKTIPKFATADAEREFWASADATDFQLLPRPGILARVRYTFDYLDLAASLLSLLVAYFVIWRITQRPELAEPS